MVARALVDEKVDAAEHLIDELDRGRFPVSTAAWFFLTEEQEWRLLLAIRAVDRQGPLAAYKAVRTALQDVGEEQTPLFTDISVVSPSDPRIRAIRKVVRIRGKGPGRVRCSRNLIDDVFIEDALVYRTN